MQWKYLHDSMILCVMNACPLEFKMQILSSSFSFCLSHMEMTCKLYIRKTSCTCIDKGKNILYRFTYVRHVIESKWIFLECCYSHFSLKKKYIVKEIGKYHHRPEIECLGCNNEKKTHCDRMEEKNEPGRDREKVTLYILIKIIQIRIPLFGWPRVHLFAHTFFFLVSLSIWPSLFHSLLLSMPWRAMR